MYQISTLDEMRPTLSNKQFYTLLDLKEGYYHCGLDDKSKKLCIFSSPLDHFNLGDYHLDLQWPQKFSKN